jgi:hypothetical protein
MQQIRAVLHQCSYHPSSSNNSNSSREDQFRVNREAQFRGNREDQFRVDTVDQAQCH